MMMPDHISQDDLALFALQLLSEQEAAIVFAHAQQCAVCRRQIAEFQSDLALYSLFAEQHEVPSGVKERFLEKIAKEPLRAAATSSPHTNKVVAMPGPTDRRLRGSFISYAGWAVAAMFAVVAGLEYQQRQGMKSEVADVQQRLAALQNNAATSQAAMSTLTNPGALTVTLRQPSAQDTVSGPQGRAAYLPDRGALVFVATNLEALKPYKVYELWLLPSKAGMAPVPAASFKPDAAGNATVILPTGPKLVEVKGFGVTQENDKSAPKQPTLPILLVGTSRS